MIVKRATCSALGLNLKYRKVLGYLFGVARIIAGTFISLLIINFGYGSQILFKHYFGERRIMEYFLRHGLYALVTLVICLVTFFVCSFINIGGISELIIKGGVCVVVPNALYYLVYCKTSMFKEAAGFVKRLVPGKKLGKR